MDIKQNWRRYVQNTVGVAGAVGAGYCAWKVSASAGTLRDDNRIDLLTLDVALATYIAAIAIVLRAGITKLFHKIEALPAGDARVAELTETYRLKRSQAIWLIVPEIAMILGVLSLAWLLLYADPQHPNRTAVDAMARAASAFGIVFLSILHICAWTNHLRDAPTPHGSPPAEPTRLPMFAKADLPPTPPNTIHIAGITDPPPDRSHLVISRGGRDWFYCDQPTIKAN